MRLLAAFAALIAFACPASAGLYRGIVCVSPDDVPAAQAAAVALTTGKVSITHLQIDAAMKAAEVECFFAEGAAENGGPMPGKSYQVGSDTFDVIRLITDTVDFYSWQRRPEPPASRRKWSI